MLGDIRKFWFQTANFGCSHVSNIKNNLKINIFGQKRILLIEKQHKISKTQKSLFSEITPFFEGSGSPRFFYQNLP